MNGRVYDYNLGRFLSVDPIITDPGNSQSINPYSYIMNNPLASTDPSGYSSCGSRIQGHSAIGCGSAYGWWKNSKSNVNVKVDKKDNGQSDVTISGERDDVIDATAKIIIGVAINENSKKETSTSGGNEANINHIQGCGKLYECSNPQGSASAQPSSTPQKVRNPSQADVDKEIAALAKQYNIPVKTLMALFDAESDFKQFDSTGNPLMPDQKKFPNSSAVGIGQITRYTAKLWGMDYKKLQTDWKYNMASSVKIFEWGYNHKWNRSSTTLEMRATRAYGFYHDGAMPYKGKTGYLNNKVEIYFRSEYAKH